MEALAWRAAVHGVRCTLHQARRRKGRGALGAPAVVWCAIKENTDYAATASDSRVLQRPLREELRPREILNVFDHPRNLRERHAPRLGSRSLLARPAACHTPTLWPVRATLPCLQLTHVAKSRAISLLWSDLTASRGACTYKGHYCNRYKLGKVLGAGSFGIVREATERKTGRRYACKTIPKVPQCPSAPACQQYILVSIQLLGFCLLPSCGKRSACL